MGSRESDLGSHLIAQRVEDAQFLLGLGEDFDRVAARLGVTPETLKQNFIRAKQGDTA